MSTATQPPQTQEEYQILLQNEATILDNKYYLGLAMVSTTQLDIISSLPTTTSLEIPIGLMQRHEAQRELDNDHLEWLWHAWGEDVSAIAHDRAENAVAVIATPREGVEPMTQDIFNRIHAGDLDLSCKYIYELIEGQHRIEIDILAWMAKLRTTREEVLKNLTILWITRVYAAGMSCHSCYVSY